METEHNMDEKKRVCVAETQKMIDVLKLAVEESEKQYEEVGAAEFTRNSGSPERGMRRLMDPIWEAYYDWFVSIGVKSRSEAEQLLKSFKPDKDVQRCGRELLQAEEAYNAFTKKLDTEMQQREDTLVPDDPLNVGSILPGDLNLIDLSSGKPVSLESVWEQSPYTLFLLERHYA